MRQNETHNTNMSILTCKFDSDSVCKVSLKSCWLEKRMGATYVGVAAAHPFSWLLSSPQQPLETEDPPTVSLAPQYTSQRLCRAIEFFGATEARENSKIFAGTQYPNVLTVKVFHSAGCKFFSISRA